MEEQLPTKRRRVYSLEPNKIAEAAFARKYVNYLVPALMKIKEKSCTSAEEDNYSHCDDDELKKNVNIVKYEVDKAMACSAQGFAWSNALKAKLQRDSASVGRSKGINGKVIPLGSSSNPSSNSETKISVTKSNHKKELAKEDNEDDEDISSQFRSMRRLIPGGEKMEEEEMVAELESYIMCLKMQVNVLQFLAETC